MTWGKGRAKDNARDLRSLVRLGMTKSDMKMRWMSFRKENQSSPPLFCSARTTHASFICEILLLLMRYSSAEVTAQAMCFPLLHIIIITVSFTCSSIQLLNHLLKNFFNFLTLFKNLLLKSYFNVSIFFKARFLLQ